MEFKAQPIAHFYPEVRYFKLGMETSENSNLSMDIFESTRLTLLDYSKKWKTYLTIATGNTTVETILLITEQVPNSVVFI